MRVHAAGVDPSVWHLMTGLPYLVRLMGVGFCKPKARVRGMDVAGRVEAVGKKVTRFQPGATVNQKDLLILKELIEAGKVTPAIDRTYPLGEVPEAIRYLEQGHARGKAVIAV